MTLRDNVEKNKGILYWLNFPMLNYRALYNNTNSIPKHHLPLACSIVYTGELQLIFLFSVQIYLLSAPVLSHGEVSLCFIVCVLCVCVCAGYGLHCHRAIITLSRLIGIKDMYCKVEGSANLKNITTALFSGLATQVRSCLQLNGPTFQFFVIITFFKSAL